MSPHHSLEILESRIAPAALYLSISAATGVIKVINGSGTDVTTAPSLGATAAGAAITVPLAKGDGMFYISSKSERHVARRRRDVGRRGARDSKDEGGEREHGANLVRVEDAPFEAPCDGDDHSRHMAREDR